MKKLIITALCLFGFSIANATDKPIPFNELPKKAKSFVETHFSVDSVSFTSIDDEFLEKSYDVVFMNGCKIEFNSKGEWKDIDCKKAVVPATILPKGISSYVSQNFNRAFIVDVEKNSKTYDVELSNGVELTFNLKGKFIRMDD